MAEWFRMHRDPNLRKRNAMAIPGTLLALSSLAGILYALFLRPDAVECEDGTLIVFAGACRRAGLLLLGPFALGLVLVGLSAIFRPRTKCHVGHGTVAATVLAVLVTLTFLPLLVGAYLSATEDPAAPYVLTYNEVDFSIVRLLGGVGLVGLVAVLPYLGLYIARSRPLRCCRERNCFEPCFCDETPAAPPPATPLPPPEPDALPVHPDPVVLPEAPFAPPAPPAAAPPMAPAAPAPAPVQPVAPVAPAVTPSPAAAARPPPTAARRPLAEAPKAAPAKARPAAPPAKKGATRKVKGKRK